MPAEATDTTNENRQSQNTSWSPHSPPTPRSPRSQSPQRSRAVSFADGDPYPPSTSIYEPVHTRGAEQDRLGDSARNTRNHDRDQGNDGPGKSSATAADSPAEPSPSNPLSEDAKASWYSRLASNYRSVNLENKGSTARDHLALERTFLAWLRTSLAFASIGIAITQLFRLNTSLTDQKQQMNWILHHLDPAGLSDKNGGLSNYHGSSTNPTSLPLSPLMGASLTPDIYTDIKSALLDQKPQQNLHSTLIQPPASNNNKPNTLLDHLLHSAEFHDDNNNSPHHAAARLRHLGKPLGATFLGISIVILFIGFHRYFESQHYIIRGNFPASRGSVALTGLITITLIVASLVVVLAVSPRS